MSRSWFPISVLSAMLLISIGFYADMLGQTALKNGLLACTVIWFVGLAAVNYWKKKD